MAAHPQAQLTADEYLAAERASEMRHEYFDGETFAMGGASRRHNLIVTNLVRELSLQLKGEPCETFANDMRVKVRETGLYTYPDLVVVCGEARFDDEQNDTLLNPTLIVEVLSDSTEAYDRGRKFEHYRALESLTDYVLVAQSHVHVEHFSRRPEHRWLLTEIGSLEDRLRLSSIGCEIALEEIYERVDLNG